MFARLSTGLLLVAFGCLLGSFLPQATWAQVRVEPYRVGVAKVDITPDYPIRLNGFGFRREESEGVAQPIWAKALAISRGDEPPVVILAIDSLGVRLPMVEQVAARLRDEFGVARERVMLTFSHSHCTPKVNGACDNIFSTPIPAAHQAHIDQYTRDLPERLYAAARDAIRDRQPATLEWKVGQVRFAKNRRPQGGPTDHDLPMLVVRGENGQPRAIYVSYACHCVTLSFNRVSGDWSGHAQEQIERQFPGAIALVSIGCGSDQNPLSGVTGDKVEVAAQQGAEIAAEVARLVGSPGRRIAGAITAQLQTIELPLNPHPTREEWQALAAKGGPAGYNATTQLARLDRGEKLPKAITYPIQSLTFGDTLHMVFLAGEVCVDYAVRLKSELVREKVWINGYSNDFCAYIPSERLAREGGYGGGAEIPYFALPATLAAGLEQRIVAEVRRQTPAAFVAVRDAGSPPPRSSKGTQGIAPKSPAESLAVMRTHPDLRVELVAAEPLITDPVAIDFGPDGRLWVAEMTDYARGVHEDFQPAGQIRVLTDRDGDGRFDSSTVFLQGLRFPTDLLVWHDGLLICDAPEILFAADTNGDGKAEVRKTLYSGFATHNPHARVNSLRLGLDHWLHGSGGLFGGNITTPSGKQIDVSNRDFRLDPERGLIEPVSGQTQQGRPRDDFDNWFGCNNSVLLDHYPVVEHYARRNPHVAPPPAEVRVPDYPNASQLFPLGDLVLFKLSGAPGRPTAACGAEIYRDELLGPEFTGNSFTCEPVNQLVHRLVLTRKGATFSGRRAPEESSREFLASTDRWFRPVQARTGPDGALWIVDMYRYVIEHPQWIPPEVLAELDVFAGQGRGRIYRVFHRDRPPRRPVRLDQLTPQELAQAIDSPNGIQRDLAHQLLLWKKPAAATETLQQIALHSKIPAARVQAAAVLSGLGQLAPEAVTQLLQDPVAEVRRHGVRLAESLLGKSPQLDLELLRRVDDPAPEVRLQLAWTLGEMPDERAAAALATLGLSSENDPYLAAAVLSSLNDRNLVGVLRHAMARRAEPASQSWIESLLTVAAAAGDGRTLTAAVEPLVAADSTPQGWRWSTLAKVLDAADRRSPAVQVSFSDAARRQASETHAAASQAALDSQAPEAIRLAALRVVGRLPGPVSQQLLGTPPELAPKQWADLLSPRSSPVLQSVAVTALGRRESPDTAELLLREWSVATPRLRNEIMQVLFARESWLRALLAALETGNVPLLDLDATRREQLLTHRNLELRKQAEKLLAASGSTSRRELLAAWQPVVDLEGSSARGREVFQKRCSPCHQLDGTGFVVGPDLAALTNKSANSLLVAVLDPNRDVDGRYVSYSAALADGRVVSGLLVSESATSVTLREQGGKDHVLLRRDVEEFRSTGRSVMPEGLEKDVSQQDLADVIAYLLPNRIPPKKFPGNQPAIVEPGPHGVVSLPASQAEIYGDEIRFESDSPWKNVGYWHAVGDYCGWQVRLPRAGRFDVHLDYSCADESAGDGFRLEGGEPVLRGAVGATGSWDKYRVQRIGTVELPAGRSYLTLRCDGPRSRPALLDLRAVFLVPANATTTDWAVLAPGAAATVGQGGGKTAAELAAMLLDDAQPTAARQQAIQDHPQIAAETIAAMTADLRNDSKEEYRRIPWIWRVAIACGKHNQEQELREVLNVSMPNERRLRDWQAVVIGGGIINGITQAGDWPKQRIESVLQVDGVLIARWQRAVDLSAAMAEDERVPNGTRYDALRMLAMGPWDLRGEQLRKYLAKDAHPELQMGSVSGIADIRHPQAAVSLLESLPHLAPRNRQLALDGLVRTPERCLALLQACAAGKVSRTDLGDERAQKLREHPDGEVRKQAAQVLAPK